MYRVSEAEVVRDQIQYKKKYFPFRPFIPEQPTINKLGTSFCNVISIQNGMDTDDYLVADNNKVERYIGNLPKNSKVLILGTGTGREVRVAKDLGYDVRATTLGSRNIDFAINYLGLQQTEVRECLNESLPFEAGTFDCVTGFQVFEHTIAPLLFLLEQGRVLKMGGTLLLEWPPAISNHMGSNPHHQICFSPGQAMSLFQKTGFENIELFYDDMTPIPVEDYWREDQQKMLVIKGTKVPSSQEYINKAWRNL